MKNLLVRCSELYKLMTMPKEKSPKQKYNDLVKDFEIEKKKLSELKEGTKSYENKQAKLLKMGDDLKELRKSADIDILSETTKTWLKEKVKEEFYGYRKQLDTPAINKGIDLENISIELLNTVDFTNHKKNEIRETNGWLTGEPDIITEDSILDIKSSWSLETFPAFQEDADDAVKKAGYDWQLRGYMLLFNKPKAAIIYCMVSTPDYLLRAWELENEGTMKTHRVDQIEPQARISTVNIERDVNLEDDMMAQYAIANRYYQEYWKEINNK